jgi:Fe-S cluster assembly ATP-binding protein
MLKVIDLHVEIENPDKSNESIKILNGLNLEVKTGEIHALMGPNGSGKSTLASVLMGDPRYKVTKGEIILDEESILELDPDERAKRGLFLSFQNPVAIPGVNVQKFLRQAYNAIHKENKASVLEFNTLLKNKSEKLGVGDEFLNRYLNDGFSGGEKKKMEILQLLMLNPKLAILDETDSGLDIDSLRLVSEGVNDFKSNNENKTVLIITHYKRILEMVKPDRVSIINKGKIVHQGPGTLVDELEEKGYGWIQDD